MESGVSQIVCAVIGADERPFRQGSWVRQIAVVAIVMKPRKHIEN